MSEQVNIHETKTHVSRLIERVESGEEIVIARAGRPAARLVPARRKGERPLGTFRGKIWMGEDFDDPLPPDMASGFAYVDEP